VTEGESAFFNCTHNGAGLALTWIINGQNYSRNDYPLRHSWNHTGQIIEVMNTTISDNGSTYQCILLNQESRIATLIVLELEQGDYCNRDNCSVFVSILNSINITMQIQLGA